MVFASFIFLFWFLPAFLPLYFAAPPRWRNLVLTLGSFVFYGWWRPHYVLLMLLSVGLDYWAARAMGAPGSGRPRRFWLWFSVVTNLGLLGWFKYANLFVGTWNDLAPWPVEWEAVLLPVGISFFTFQSMSYTIDVYRGDVPPVRSFLDLLCFVSMFPQLVAGPIVRYSDIQHELQRRTVDLKQFSDGVFLFALGLAKKVLIADSVGPLVDAVYAQDAPGLLASWAAAFGYSIQIYFDFSGYSDMAVGLGLLLGFHFPPNFLSPYRAHSITELWRRWHVSLSTWLRDYLYVPLGGNRRGEGRAQCNVALTMLLGGLWHGASWTYMLWGGWHGFFLVLERRFGKVSPYGRLPLVGQVFCTFLIWTLGLVIFRCLTVTELGQMARGLVGGNGLGALPDLGQQQPFAWGGLWLGLFIAFALPRSDQLVARFHPLVMLGTLLLFGLAICQLLTQDFVSFIYYQF
ncbi:MAG: MBOAT family protein [Planctomycetes bacterium]|nr:MBOAT family protein [Planctomycetota bacterium]